MATSPVWTESAPRAEAANNARETSATGIHLICFPTHAKLDDASRADFSNDRKTFGAGEGNRTLVCSLGSCRSTIELRPRSAGCVLLISRDCGFRQAAWRSTIGRRRPFRLPA